MYRPFRFMIRAGDRGYPFWSSRAFIPIRLSLSHCVPPSVFRIVCERVGRRLSMTSRIRGEFSVYHVSELLRMSEATDLRTFSSGILRKMSVSVWLRVAILSMVLFSWMSLIIPSSGVAFIPSLSPSM